MYRVMITDGLWHDCDTVGELARALDITPRAVSGYTNPDDELTDLCLCSVDDYLLAAMTGRVVRKATDAEGFPFPDMIIEAQP